MTASVIDWSFCAVVPIGSLFSATNLCTSPTTPLRSSTARLTLFGSSANSPDTAFTLTCGALLWPLIAIRWIGATLLVPVMEELFWRSFLMRWVQNPVFEAVDPSRVGLKAIVLSTFVFTLAHTMWLAAVIAGLAYALLYRFTGKLWVAVIAHAVTNGALGIWVVRTGHWAFW